MSEATMTTNDVVPLVAFASIATVIGSTIVGLRLYSRAVLLKRVGADDWVLALACVLGFAAYGLVMVLTIKDMRTADPNGTTNLDSNFGYKNLSMLATVIMSTQNVVSRISLLLSYRRITPETFRKMRIFLNVLLIFFPITAVMFFIAGIAPCWPPRVIIYGQEFYKLLATGQIKCIRASFVNLVGTLYGLTGDVLVYIIPFLIIRMAGLQKKQRIATYSLFALGGLVFLISLSRIPFMLVFGHKSLSNVPISQVMIIWMFSFAESNGIMVTASIPTLRPLIRRIKGWHCSPPDIEDGVLDSKHFRPVSKFSW